MHGTTHSISISTGTTHVQYQQDETKRNFMPRLRRAPDASGRRSGGTLAGSWDKPLAKECLPYYTPNTSCGRPPTRPWSVLMSDHCHLDRPPHPRSGWHRHPEHAHDPCCKRSRNLFSPPRHPFPASSPVRPASSPALSRNELPSGRCPGRSHGQMMQLGRGLGRGLSRCLVGFESRTSRRLPESCQCSVPSRPFGCFF